MKTISVEVAGQTVDFEVNSFARQCDGSVLLRTGDTVLLITANAAPKAAPGVGFFPLTMEYVERSHAAGKIPGGFFKREGRPSEKAILTARLMDRPIRPLVAEGFVAETQVICTVLSIDGETQTDTLAVTGASFALAASSVPLTQPLGCVRIGKIDGQLKVNPTAAELATSDLDLVIASTEEAIVMVEGGANELPEDEMLDALMLGFESAQPFVKAQKQMIAELGKTKREPDPVPVSDEFIKRAADMFAPGITEAQQIHDKLERYSKYRDVKDEVKAKLEEDESVSEEEIAYLGEVAEGVKKKIMRKTLADTGKRIGGRTTTEIRDIESVVSFLPRTHGSAVFTRGETRALVTATLGAGDDEQRIDALEGEYSKRFMLHYNFPPYSVGEVKFLRSPGRREIGHGALAERALVRMLPDPEDFPYTVRIVSDIMESNGSSSMATVCGGTLALMDAGVPMKAPVAGIAMGLIQEEGKFHILSDILGDEDHIGDMDFKVTGTRKGITALQMDIKISGVSREVLEQALAQARDGRLHILGKMEEAIDKPRTEISKYAPRIETLKVSPDKIKDIIGPGGKMIRSIIADTGVKIDVEDNGDVKIYSDDLEMMTKAADIIKSICEEAEIGKTYNGTVKRVVDFGCFVEIFPGTEGLVHVSQLDTERVEVVADFIKEGDPIEVKVVDIDRDGKIRLSRKAVLTGTDGREDLPPPRRGGGRGRGNFGGRRGNR